ncbi:MAG TPA: ABC transporter permease [Thermoplasmata archaeon]|nr:ABC transporter permease [Thermoplasmata archaeon]
MQVPNILRLIYRNILVNTDPGSLIILIGLPGMYLVFFGFGFSSLASAGGSSTAYLNFLTPGIMAFQVVMAGTVGGSMLWADRRWGMLSQLLMGPFTRLQYLLGIMLTSVLFGLGGAAVMLAVAYALLGSVPAGAVALTLIFGSITIGSVFFGALMLYIGALVKSNTAYNSIQILLIFVVNFASTVFYPLSSGLPAVMRVLFEINPLTYVADAVRGAYSSNFTPTDAYQMLVLVVEMVVALVLATRAYMRSDVSYE